MKKLILLFLLLFFTLSFSQTMVWEKYPSATTKNDSFSVDHAIWKVTGDDSVYSVPVKVGKWHGGWSSTVKVVKQSGTVNFKLVVQLKMPDGSWADCPDLTWRNFAGDTTFTSFIDAYTSGNSYWHFSTEKSTAFWVDLVGYSVFRWKLVFTGAQKIWLYQWMQKY